MNYSFEARDTSYLIDPAGACTRPRRGRLSKSVRCRGASSRLVDRPWRLIRIRQWALWVLLGEFWYHRPPGAIAPKIVPADADGDPGARLLNVAVGGEHSPVIEMASTVAERPVLARADASAASADRGAGSDTATDDDDGEDDAAPTDSDFFTASEASSSAAEVVHRAEIGHRAGRAGARDEIVDHRPSRRFQSEQRDQDFRRRTHAEKAAHVRAEHVVRAQATGQAAGPPTGYYYYTGGAATYIQNPGGACTPKLSALNPTAPLLATTTGLAPLLTSKTLPAPTVRQALPRQSPTQAGRTAPPAPAPPRGTRPARTAARTR